MTSELPLPGVVSRIVQEILASPLNKTLRRSAGDVCHLPQKTEESLKSAVIASIRYDGLDKYVRNFVHRYIQGAPGHLRCIVLPEEATDWIRFDAWKEPVDYILKAQQTWERRVQKSLNSMAMELKLTLSRERAEEEQREMLRNWDRLGDVYTELLDSYRPVYAAKDFLDVICNLRNPNLNPDEENEAFCRCVHMPLSVPSISEIRRFYTEIESKDHGNERMRVGEVVTAAEESCISQEFAKRGCPVHLRCTLWKQILGATSRDDELHTFDELKSLVLQWDLLTDKLIIKDIRLTAANDDHYFVFEDKLYQVLLCFTRDSHMLRVHTAMSSSPPTAYLAGRLETVIYPPCGIIPYHGISLYLVPLCFVFQDISSLYTIFRELYVRFFCNLHCLSTKPDGLLSLCALFESLLYQEEKQLALYLVSVGAAPLRIAFRWLIRAFAGYLCPSELLELWDRIIAYNSTQLVAVLAVAIFSAHRSSLLIVESLQEAEALLSDLTSVRVVPLLQTLLYPSSTTR